MAIAYRRLHAAGWAHSFEAWLNGRLAGGLYGVAIGRVFFGESMFANERDASKVALVRAIDFLQTRGFELLDCQVPSAHMTSLGATSVPRDVFLQQLDALCEPMGQPCSWDDEMGEK
jgi:leucyl/phenylalanyl-tRNA--protein transferase